jgi:hypothetical protein
MTHLSPQQFTDAIEGTLAPVHEQHLEACEQCRTQVASFRSLSAGLQSVSALEPSPLFWDHLSERVRAATRAEPIPAEPWWHGVWNPALTIGLAAAVMAIVFVVRVGPAGPARPAAVAGESVLAGVVDDPANRPPEFVVDVAASLPMDDLQEVARPTPDATAARMDQLTPAQRAEFMRLVKARMNGAE